MDKVLLIVSDLNLRQLYHELLLSKTLEVLPVEDIGDATILLTLNQFSCAIIFADGKNTNEIEIFLNLRKKHRTLIKTKIVLLTPDDIFESLLIPTDLTLDPLLQSPVEMIERIKFFVSNP